MANCNVKWLRLLHRRSYIILFNLHIFVLPFVEEFIARTKAKIDEKKWLFGFVRPVESVSARGTD